MKTIFRVKYQQNKYFLKMSKKEVSEEDEHVLIQQNFSVLSC